MIEHEKQTSMVKPMTVNKGSALEHTESNFKIKLCGRLEDSR